MNLVDAYVTRVLGKPEFLYGKWWLEVEANCYGSKMKTKLMLATEDEALAVNKGHHFLT